MKLIRCHILSLVMLLVKVTCQDQITYQLPVPPLPTSTAGQLCVSQCNTCPVTCLSPPFIGGGAIQPPPLPPRLPAPSPPETIQPVFPPPPLPPPQLPPLLPLLPPPPPQASHTQPPPTPSSLPLLPPSGGGPKGDGSGGIYQPSPPFSFPYVGGTPKSPSPPVSFPYVSNPATPTTPYPYYYYEESNDCSLSLHLQVLYLFLIVFLSFQMGFIGFL